MLRWPAWCCDIDGIDSVHVHTLKVTGVFSLVDSSTMAHGQSTTAPRVAISNAKFAKVLRYHLGGAARWWGEPSHEKQICSYRIWPVCFASKKTREFCKLKRKLCHFRFTFILPNHTESVLKRVRWCHAVPCLLPPKSQLLSMTASHPWQQNSSVCACYVWICFWCSIMFNPVGSMGLVNYIYLP